MRYFLGIDVGGTKTHALIANENGDAVGFGEAGPGNHEGVGYDGLANALKESTQKALDYAGLKVEQLTAGGFGVAGYDWPSEKQDTLDAITKIGLKGPVEPVNDAVVGLLAGASKGWGVAVDAGTGDNCWGRDWNGKEAHMTGCGPTFGEYGGAGSLVYRAIKCISYEWGHRGPKTRLSDEFMKVAGVKTLDDLLEGLSQGRFWFDAELAPMIFKVAEEGDEVARGTITWAAEELASMVNGIIRQLKFEELECDVVMIGSMFKGGVLLIEPFTAAVRKVAPNAQFVRLRVPPVVGGVILAMEQVGMKADAPIREVLNNSVQRILGK
jgi:N-acetylglucosamine kinase-like BadF-type ATPase